MLVMARGVLHCAVYGCFVEDSTGRGGSVTRAGAIQ